MVHVLLRRRLAHQAEVFTVERGRAVSRNAHLMNHRLSNIPSLQPHEASRL